MKSGLIATAVVLSAAGLQAQPRGHLEIVSVTGCLRESAGRWRLVAATDPEPSTANAPDRSELPTRAPAGARIFHLIGISDFKLPQHRDRTVVVKGLLIPAQPVSRLDLTAVVTALPTCAPGAEK